MLILVGQQANVYVLAITCETSPSDPVTSRVDNLCLAALNRQEEIIIIGIDTVLDLRPHEDLDRVVIYIYSFSIFIHLTK
jgi:hypothetical protein